MTEQKKINILELRCVRGSGGGPEKTIFLTALKIDPTRFQTHIVYIRDEDDQGFNLMRQQYFESDNPNVFYKELYEKGSFDFSLVSWLKDYCFKKKIDIIHSHEYKTDVLAKLVYRNYPIAWLATYHLHYADSLKLKLYQYLDMRALKTANKVLTVSESLFNLLKKKKIPLSRLENMPNGIDTTYFDPQKTESTLQEELGVSKEKTLIGYVGRLSEQKNLPLLLKAFQRLIVQGKEVELVLVGEGELKEQIDQLIDKMELRKWVHLVGFVDDIRMIYKGLDLMVLSSNEEGMPNSILEAMAMEVPVVSTNVGGVNELIQSKENGLICPSKNLEALIASMVQLIDHPGLRNEYGKKSRNTIIEKFSFDKRVKRLEEVYKELYEKFH